MEGLHVHARRRQDERRSESEDRTYGQVAVHDAEGVEVVDAADELVHEPLDLHRREVVLPVRHLAARVGWGWRIGLLD
jgi:hypothetical protein